MYTFRHLAGIVLLLSAVAATGGEKVRILALGDSITQGGGHFMCYRQFLVPELKKRGLPVEFVGPQRDKTSAHAGYSGKNTDYLCRNVEGIFTKHPADIVLIHAGHNNWTKDKPIPKIVRNTKAIITTLREHNPKVIILLGQVIPAGKLPKYAYILDLNRKLAKIPKQMSSARSPIILVNHAKGFNWRKDTVQDKVHPNASGAKKMSDRWLKALLPILKKR